MRNIEAIPEPKEEFDAFVENKENEIEQNWEQGKSWDEPEPVIDDVNAELQSDIQVDETKVS